MPRTISMLLLLAAAVACTGDPAAPATSPSTQRTADPALAREGDAKDHTDRKGHADEVDHGRGGALAHDLATLTQRTAPFHRIEAATAAGWTEQLTGCMSLPGVGGMGYHYGNPDLIDGRVAVNEPELLVYEPQKNGRLRLVAVEYIVPLDAWTAEDPPHLFGHDFHVNEAFGLWVLHVWLWKHNPAGLFEDWNPTVSCDAVDM